MGEIIHTAQTMLPRSTSRHHLAGCDGVPNGSSIQTADIVLQGLPAWPGGRDPDGLRAGLWCDFILKRRFKMGLGTIEAYVVFELCSGVFTMTDIPQTCASSNATETTKRRPSLTTSSVGRFVHPVPIGPIQTVRTPFALNREFHDQISHSNRFTVRFAILLRSC